MEKVKAYIHPLFACLLCGWLVYLAIYIKGATADVIDIHVPIIFLILISVLIVFASIAFYRDSFILALLLFLFGNWVVLYLYGMSLYYGIDLGKHQFALFMLPVSCNSLALLRCICRFLFGRELA